MKVPLQPPCTARFAVCAKTEHHFFLQDRKVWPVPMILICFLFSTQMLWAQCVRTVVVSNDATLTAALADATPGDCIVLADGNYAGFTVSRSGTESNPVVIRSANQGGAVVTSGIIRYDKTSFVTISGLRITTPGSSQTIDGESYRVAVWFDASTSCRLTSCTIRLTGQPSTTHWVMLGGNGNHNRVDHNEFGPNTVSGHYVWPRGQRSIPGVTPPADRTSWANGNGPVNPNIPLNTRIDHNYFHDQAAGASETIVLGGLGVTGDYQDYHTIVEQNLFVNCNGDAEIISIKSSGNTIRQNTVRRSKGMIVSRAGNNNIIHGNFILGEGVVGTGGIRFYEKDHLIYNNYIEVDDLPLVIGGGDPYNGTFSHAQVFRARVVHNQFISRIAPVTINYNQASHPLPPVDIEVANNIIQVSQGKNVNVEAPATNALYSLNMINLTGTATAGVSGTGWVVQNPLLTRQGELLKLISTSPAIDASNDGYPLGIDVEGQPRISSRDIGADEFFIGTMPFKPLTAADVGPGTDESAVPPASPSALTATAAFSDQINLSWTDNSNNENTFRIERSTNGGASWSLLATLGANNNSYSNTGLSSSTTYHYRVRAENAAGNSGFTSTASATTPAPSPDNICLEAERGGIVMPIFQIVSDASASKQQAIKVSPGFNSQNAPPESGQIIYTFNAEGGIYKVWARVSAPTTGDDSFWVKMDWEGEWIKWNEIARSTGWLWDEVHDSDSANTVMTFNLAPGSHRLTIAYREDGIRLDQLLITNNLSFVPSGTGPCAMLPPAAPSALISTVISSSQINLRWTDNSNNERIFKVERSDDGGTTWTDPRYLDGNSTSAAYGSLTPLSTYHFRVRAENDEGVSAYANIISAATPADPPVPKSPSDLRVTSVTENEITIAWNDNSDDETNFVIWKTGPDIREIVATPPANSTSFTDTGLLSDRAYYYSVWAENANGTSEFFKEVKAVTLCACLPRIFGIVQAEELTKSGYENSIMQGVIGARASSTATGSLRGRVTNPSGSAMVLDITVRYFDESDGQSPLRVYVGGTLVGSRTMNADDNNWKTWILNGITAADNAEIRIESARAGGEEGFIDYIEVVGSTPGYISFQAEDGTPTAPFNTLVSSTAAQHQFISVTSGTNSNTSAPATGRATYLFTLATSGTFKIWGRILALNDGSDSFWVRIDNGTWIKWNNQTPSSDWIYDDVHNSDNGGAVMTWNLSAGNHTITIAYREIGSKLDELFITNNLTYDPNEIIEDRIAVASPTDEDPSASTNASPEGISTIIYPNPTSGETNIDVELKEGGRVRILLLSTLQRDMIVLKDGYLPAGRHKVTFDAGKLSNGIYVIRAVQNRRVVTTKFIKK